MLNVLMAMSIMHTLSLHIFMFCTKHSIEAFYLKYLSMIFHIIINAMQTKYYYTNPVMLKEHFFVG